MLELLHSEFETLLRSHLTEAEGLDRIYNSCLRVPEALNHLRTEYEKFVEREGLACVQHIAKTSMNVRLCYFVNLLL